MTKKELIELLQPYHDDLNVCILRRFGGIFRNLTTLKPLTKSDDPTLEIVHRCIILEEKDND